MSEDHISQQVQDRILEVVQYREQRNATETDVDHLHREIERLEAGGKELGWLVVQLAELIRDAYRLGATDPIGALHLLGDHLADLLPDEGGLEADEHNRIYRALNTWRTSSSSAGGTETGPGA